jgi:hypothetical protein
MIMRSKLSCCALLLGAFAFGCADKPTIFPPSDPNLRRTSAEFAADAAKRHPYKADAPRGGQAVARAQVDYMADEIDVINLSKEDWENVEVWVNQNYVVFLPTMPAGKLEPISFKMLYDDSGKTFPTKHVMVDKLELYRGGKMYDCTVKLGD